LQSILISKEEIFNKIVEYKDLYPFSDIVPLSALKNKNVDELIKVVKTYLKDEFQYYGTDDITNKSIEFLMAEMVREKVMNLTEQEVPHSITCQTQAVEVGKTSYTVYIDIIVDRESLKKIVIGKQGNMLKTIGSEARKDIEKLIGKKVFLELYVRTIKNWRNKDKYLNELGFDEL
jgi:GTP-binding protein Era